jgi:formate hydrogenlyase subunit 7
VSRWIALGLRSGVRTTGYPSRPDPDAEIAPSAVIADLPALSAAQAVEAAGLCPTTAITVEGDRGQGAIKFDAGQCVMCGRCVRAFPAAFSFTHSPDVAVRSRERLQVGARWAGGSAPAADADAAALTIELERRSQRLFRRSLHIRHVDAGSCNGCESELQLLGSPEYDLHRLGLFFTPTPRHADALLVTGVVTRQMEQPLRDTYDAMPHPKIVVAAGVCAVGGGVFEGGFMVNGPLDRILPVDVYVPGCPPTPLALLHGLLVAVGRGAERHRAGGGRDGA